MTREQRAADEAAENAAVFASMQKEMEDLRKQLADARTAMIEGRGQEAERERQMQEQLEKEREARVKHLGQMGLKRIMQQGLARGWTKWHDQWEAYSKNKQRLANSAARLSKPKLVASFVHWQKDWEYEMAAAAKMTHAQLLAAERSKASAAETELAKVREELMQARKAMLEGRGMEAERERLAAEQLEAERQKRVEHLAQVGMRRIMQQGLARGWSAWYDQWEEYTRNKRLLAAAGQRLTKPKLVQAFMHWQRDWDVEMASEAMMTEKDRLTKVAGEAVAMQESMQKEIDQLRAELTKAKEAAKAGAGMRGDLQREMEAQLEAERQKRIEHLAQNGMRRIMHQDLARGWSAWHGMWADLQHKKRLLANSAARLSKPKLVASFKHWQNDWEADAAAFAKMTHGQRLASEVEKRNAVESELHSVREELRQARKAMAEGRGMEAERERQMKEQLEQEREARVQHLAKVGLRRICQMGLARGWTAWHDQYENYTRNRRMLANSAQRLARPKLVACFVKWQRDWDAEMAIRATKSKQQLAEEAAAEAEAMNASLQKEMDTLRKELADARQAMLEGRGMEAEKARLAQEQLEREREARVQHLAKVGLRRICQMGLARGWTAWHDQWEAYTRNKRMLANSAQRLARPKLVACFVHWQNDWEAEILAEAKMSEKEKLAAKMAEASAEKADLQREIDRLKQQLAKALEGVQGATNDAQRQLQEQLEAEKQKRIEHLAQNGMRRIMHQDLARGWSAWHGLWSDVQHKKRLLANSAARLSKPKLVACFVHWQKDWEYESLSTKMMTHEERIADADRKRNAAEAELSKVREELAKARKAMAEGRGMEAERERRAQEELEAERQKRVEHLVQVGVRRIFQQGLARGWSAWHDQWEDYQHKRLLANSAQRLARPKLVHSFVHWQRDWEAELLIHKSKSAQQLAEEEAAAKTARVAALSQENENLKRELNEARKAMAEGRGLEAERERQMQLKLEQEKEQRVQQLANQGLKRIMQQGLARGWTAWHDQFVDYQRKKQMLANSAARLSKPKLVACFNHWRR